MDRHGFFRYISMNGVEEFILIKRDGDYIDFVGKDKACFKIKIDETKRLYNLLIGLANNSDYDDDNEANENGYLIINNRPVYHLLHHKSEWNFINCPKLLCGTYASPEYDKKIIHERPVFLNLCAGCSKVLHAKTTKNKLARMYGKQ